MRLYLIDEELHVFCEIYSFTSSKPLLLESRKMSFSPGDLIWAKMRGYPHWPARVSSIYFEIKADESEGLAYVTLRDRGSLLKFFSVRDERNLYSQPHDFLSCLRELRQRLSRETPLPILETKRHFLLFRGNSLRQHRSKKTSVCRQLLFLRRMCRLKLQQKPIEWKFPMLFDLQRKLNSKQQFLSHHLCRVACWESLREVLKGKVWRVQVANLHNAARALSCPSKCFQPAFWLTSAMRKFKTRFKLVKSWFFKFIRPWPWTAARSQASQAKNTWCKGQFVYIENCMGKSPIMKKNV